MINTYYSWPGLGANTLYRFEVTAANETGSGAASVGISTYTGIQSPETFGIGEVGATIIKIGVMDELSNLGIGDSGWRIKELRRDTDSGWQVSRDSYTFIGLVPNTSYWFRMNARNSVGMETEYSTE